MNQPLDTLDPKTAEARKWAAIVYALQALGFLVGISYIAAVIVAYLKRNEAEGTWVAEHFRWQIATFWYSLLWGLLGAAALVWMVGYMILIADLLWMTYRIVVGWVRLSENRSPYST
ncbi:hypothetical protein MIT9_P2398 [Methylomarinovum caldicuralii]|uniref:Transmembrane protein n=1 Tax=Methylomarinovum caldicuralii TaxID=438856 RepID=A0AAU9C238_9GAMM|nr:hypothetical protein [Methylomarinovum caldicuralii]BCX82810.1 hypothetical protein MIT9_P2398 [Methylomarinovum caldicuralii]